MYVVVLAAIAWSVTSSSDDRRYFLGLGLIWAIGIPISVIRSRRIQRNVARLADSSG